MHQKQLQDVAENGDEIQGILQISVLFYGTYAITRIPARLTAADEYVGQ